MSNTTLNDEKTTGVTKTFEIEIEELEAIIAPVTGVRPNHNETLIRDTQVEEISVEIEELEAIIAPGIGRGLPNHNETLVRDTE